MHAASRLSSHVLAECATRERFALGIIDVDPLFQPILEGYSLTVSGLVALKANHYRSQIQPKQVFDIVSNVSKNPMIEIQSTFALIDRYGSVEKAMVVPCCMVVGLAYEWLASDPRYISIGSDPAVQFLRHLRNAAFHGNQFNMRADLFDPATGQLKKKASWRSIELLPSHNGTAPFFKLLEAGDPLWLLHDITQLLKST